MLLVSVSIYLFEKFPSHPVRKLLQFTWVPTSLIIYTLLVTTPVMLYPNKPPR
ncbi:hypothetical protein BDV39DRAFT_179347 [Aspergillus sergii]|uniref:Uncharacterized protein n=1 Tax=Aspergillus sergii TaxID=1034303 RepID=A0A5N6WW58_9EURO|nr:hypothetical protein BDV39DRAFT_179347 [Aspergillus sergii]